MKQPTIDQIKQEQSIFTDLWNIYKKYCNISTESEWEQFVKETNFLSKNKYSGTTHEEMFRDLLQAIISQLERNYKLNKIH
jgi:hypothetical protein